MTDILKNYLDAEQEKHWHESRGNTVMVEVYRALASRMWHLLSESDKDYLENRSTVPLQHEE